MDSTLRYFAAGVGKAALGLGLLPQLLLSSLQRGTITINHSIACLELSTDRFLLLLCALKAQWHTVYSGHSSARKTPPGTRRERGSTKEGNGTRGEKQPAQEQRHCTKHSPACFSLVIPLQLRPILISIEFTFCPLSTTKSTLHNK